MIQRERNAMAGLSLMHRNNFASRVERDGEFERRWISGKPVSNGPVSR